MTRIRVLMVVVCIAGGVLAVPTAAQAAPTPTIHGDLKCAVGPALMHFDPALVFFRNQPHVPKSRVTLTAAVSACRGTTVGSPAPGGIHHGVVTLKGRLRRNTCLDLAIEGPGTAGYSLSGSLWVKVSLFNASGARVAKNRFGTGELLVMLPGYPANPIGTMSFSSTLKSTAKAFGGEAASLSATHDATTFSARCAAGPVPDLPVTGGALTMGNPT